jgi:hypothetical protein
LAVFNSGPQYEYIVILPDNLLQQWVTASIYFVSGSSGGDSGSLGSFSGMISGSSGEWGSSGIFSGTISGLSGKGISEGCRVFFCHKQVLLKVRSFNYRLK